MKALMLDELAALPSAVDLMTAARALRAAAELIEDICVAGLVVTCDGGQITMPDWDEEPHDGEGLAMGDRSGDRIPSGAV